MEALIKKMAKDLGLEKLLEDQDQKGTDDAKLKGAIMLIYNSGKERICKVADNVARGKISSGDEALTILDSPVCPSLPDNEVWNFKLGDTVRIKLSRDDFKWMQKQTLGWRCDLNQLIGQVGVVINVYCEYENAIGVYFPDVFMGRSLYAGVLEKVSSREDPCLLRRWKVGDYVKTVSSPKVLTLLQRGLDQIPDKYIGKKGRVVAVTHPCVVVTFNNVSALDLKSSALVRCTSDEDDLSVEPVVHAHGFKVGDEVKIISNLKKLIAQQKGIGGWNSSMTKICGEKARIIHIQEDNSMNIQIKNFRAWRLNSESVLGLSEIEEPQEDLKFLPGDVVKVIVPRNIRSILAMAEVPSVFLEYLRSPAVVALVDDDIDYYIKFNVDQNIQTHEKIIRKATALEREAYEKVQNLTENITVGDQVYLDIGPPNFVQSVISELDIDPTVAMALTKPATLEGYTNAYTAVIKYEDGTRIRLKKKYLTVPQKFHVDDCKSAISIRTIGHIEEAIKRSVQDIHSRENSNDDWDVMLTYMQEGNPPCLEFRVRSIVAAFGTILSWLKDNSGWNIERICDGQIVATGADESNDKLEIKVGIIFNDEPSEFRDKETSDLSILSGTIEEGPIGNNKSQPFNRPTEDTNISPDITRFDQLSYFRLYDPALARDVFFPYVIHGDRRTTVEPPNRGPTHPPSYDYSTNRITINYQDLSGGHYGSSRAMYPDADFEAV